MCCQGGNVFVQVGFGIRLGRLQCHRLGDDKGMVRGPVVHAEIDDALADLFGVDAGIAAELLPAIAHLLDAPCLPLLGIGRADAADLQHLVQQVVVVQDGDLGDFAQALRRPGS